MENMITIASLVVATAGVIISTIAAIFAAGSYRLAKRSDKGYIREQIADKQRKIRELNFQQDRKYGLNRNQREYTPERIEIEKLQQEILELESRL